MQARYWILTIKAELFQNADQFAKLFKDTVQLTYLKGQQEVGKQPKIGSSRLSESSSSSSVIEGRTVQNEQRISGSSSDSKTIDSIEYNDNALRTESVVSSGNLSNLGGTVRPSGGFVHWQLVAYFKSRVRLRTVKSIFGESIHAEPTRSDAAAKYVHKDETSVMGTRFEFGTIPNATRNLRDHKDWEAIKCAARQGRLDDIPPDVYCRNYNTLKRIAVDHMAPVAIERTITVYWGSTGVGKSRLAWDQAGLNAYPKDPRSKFWDGYSNQERVVIDEFRGGIDIAHVLRWFDRYPVIVEVKGSSTVLSANQIWITSNLHPRLWYPDIDSLTFDALMRRLKVYQMFPDGSMIEEISN